MAALMIKVQRQRVRQNCGEDGAYAPWSGQGLWTLPSSTSGGCVLTRPAAPLGGGGDERRGLAMVIDQHANPRGEMGGRLLSTGKDAEAEGKRVRMGEGSVGIWAWKGKGKRGRGRGLGLALSTFSSFSPTLDTRRGGLRHSPQKLEGSGRIRAVNWSSVINTAHPAGSTINSSTLSSRGAA